MCTECPSFGIPHSYTKFCHRECRVLSLSVKYGSSCECLTTYQTFLGFCYVHARMCFQTRLPWKRFYCVRGFGALQESTFQELLSTRLTLLCLFIHAKQIATRSQSLCCTSPRQLFFFGNEHLKQTLLDHVSAAFQFHFSLISFIRKSNYFVLLWQCAPSWLKHFLNYRHSVGICNIHEGVSKCFRTGRLERELQMVQLYATRCSCIAILWVSLVSFATITLCVASQWAFVVVYFVIDSVRKLLDTPSYEMYSRRENS
jgi:hypothetical protein